MLVLAIWLFLAGYTIAIAGKRNLSVSYQPQADGSIKAVDGQGNDAKAYSLMDVVSCGDASVSIQGQPAPLATGAPARPAGSPTPPPVPASRLNPAALLNPLPTIGEIRPPTLTPVPVPNQVPGSGILADVAGWERGVSQEVYDTINRLVGGVRHLVSGVHLPGLPAPRPQP